MGRPSGAAQAEVEEAGNGCGFCVFLGAGEEPVGRHRLEHVLEDQAVVRQRVEVARKGSVHEPDEHAELDLLDKALLREVRTNAPVLLGRINRVVVDPVTPRRLQQWMIEEEREPTAGPNHPCHLGDRVIDIVDVFEHETRHGGVEARIGKRQFGRARSHVRRSPAALARDADLVPGRVDAHNVGARGGEEPTDLSITAADVEYTAEARQLLERHRQNLLDVLRVSALGEAVDPPLGMGFPQIVRHRARGYGPKRYGQPMKFSVWPNPARPTSEILDLARLVDAAGWYGMWFADHYMPNTGNEDIQPGDVHECWAMLPAIAAVTERIRLGSLVAPTSVHHPAVLANRAASIDHISNGRMVLGIGAGWQINEHHAYGIELQEPGPRVTRFEEAIQIIRSLLANDRTDFHGEFYDITDAPADPKPVQSPLPILVGTGSPRMLRITARHADEWNTWGAPDMAGGALTKLLTACEQVDRDPATLWKSAQALVFVSDNADLAANIRAGEMGERSILGSNDQLIEEFGRYAELGFDELIIPDFTLGGTAEERFANYRTLQSDVISQLG